MDVSHPCKNALVSFLCTLIDEQVFHLTNSQSVGQDKILSCRDLLFQIIFSDTQQLLKALYECQ